ncbi:MAG: hypothetical protein KDB02_02270 [Acidimicrobiales bacterium]|nr:hypothetical protein [Acidimicrobiales bacterium]
MRRPALHGRGRPGRRDLRNQLVGGEHVELDVQLRRTSARGWGPWTDGIVILGPMPASPVSWHVEDPVAVGLSSTRGPVSADFEAIDRVVARPVRFRTEAFWGLDAEIIVLHSERATTEIAMPPELTGPAIDRLAAQLLCNGATGSRDDTPDR